MNAKIRGVGGLVFKSTWHVVFVVLIKFCMFVWNCLLSMLKADASGYVKGGYGKGGYGKGDIIFYTKSLVSVAVASKMLEIQVKWF